MVTRETPDTGFIPSFCTAFRLFFSERLCFPRPSSAKRQAERGHQVWCMEDKPSCKLKDRKPCNYEAIPSHFLQSLQVLTSLLFVHIVVIATQCVILLISILQAKMPPTCGCLLPQGYLGRAYCGQPAANPPRPSPPALAAWLPALSFCCCQGRATDKSVSRGDRVPFTFRIVGKTKANCLASRV
jgi:hypothetical protein